MLKIKLGGRNVYAAFLALTIIFQLLAPRPVLGQFVCVDRSEGTEFSITKEEALYCRRCTCDKVYADCMIGPDSYGFIIA